MGGPAIYFIVLLRQLALSLRLRYHRAGTGVHHVSSENSSLRRRFRPSQPALQARRLGVSSSPSSLSRSV